jgi:hypothetical protein
LKRAGNAPGLATDCAERRKSQRNLGGAKMSEQLPEQQKPLLVIRSPLSEDGFVSVYFSTREGRLMNEEEWWNLRQLIELTNKVCVKQQARGQTA